MKINVEVIDRKGFWGQQTAKSKKLVLEWLNCLQEGTEIHWKNKRNVFVSQQYIRR